MNNKVIRKLKPNSSRNQEYSLKKWVFRLIAFTIGLGLIVPFLSEVVLTIWFPGVTMGLDIWNQFVSIILGVVATVLSIVSMIMGFKNYDDTLEIQEKYTKTLQHIEKIASDVDTVKSDVKMAIDGKIQKISSDNPWNQEPVEQ